MAKKLLRVTAMLLVMALLLCACGTKDKNFSVIDRITCHEVSFMEQSATGKIGQKHSDCNGKQQKHHHGSEGRKVSI